MRIDSFEDIMQMETGVLKYIMNLLKTEYKNEVELLHIDIPEIKEIPVLKFMEAKEILMKKFKYQPTDMKDFDIHDRVNYSVQHSKLTINPEKTLVTLTLTVDPQYGSVMDYFEIFLERMILCRKAAETLGLQFRLMINGQALI